MLEQIKKAVDEWDALDIETRALLFKSNALHKQMDKFNMDRYNLQRKLDTALVESIPEKITDLLDNIRETNTTVKKLREEYHKIRKEYSHTWPKVDLAKKKVEKLKKKFWEQEGLAL